MLVFYILLGILFASLTANAIYLIIMAVKRKRWEKTRREFWREYIRCGGTWDDIFDGDFKSEVIDRMDPLYKDLYDSNN